MPSQVSSSTTPAPTRPNTQTRLPSIAPSQLASDLEPHIVPKEMESDDIRRVVKEWADAAVRARDCGFDIVYVYGAHSYLPMQFLSPFYNKRTDGYGGGLKERARFWLETLAAVRDTIGADCAVVTRIAVDALGPAGIHVEEALEFVNLADDLVDLWDVNVGSIAYWSKDSGTSRYFQEGYQLEWTGGIRQATAKPIVGVGRLDEPRTAWPRSFGAARGIWSAPHARRSPIRSSRRRSPRAAPTRSESAPARTSAS